MTFAQEAAESSTEREVPAAEAAQPGASSGGATGSYEPRWSIGAGVGWARSFSVVNALSQTGVILTDPSVPQAIASLERAIGPRTWLVLGASGTIDRYRSDLPEGTTGVDKVDNRQFSLNVGVRQIVTSAGAPVDVSLVFLAEGGIADSKGSWTGAFSGELDQWTTWQLGASGGLAVDRELTRGLSVRIGTPILGVAWTRSRTKVSDARDLWSSSFTAGLNLAPYAELRLAF
jgi:hypothetical protein